MYVIYPADGTSHLNYMSLYCKHFVTAKNLCICDQHKHKDSYVLHFITTVLKNQIQILIPILDLTDNKQLMATVRLAWIAINSLNYVKTKQGILNSVFFVH